MSRTRRAPRMRHKGRWVRVNRAELKQDAREGRRAIDRAILRSALAGADDAPTRTRNAECADRWSHD